MYHDKYFDLNFTPTWKLKPLLIQNTIPMCSVSTLRLIEESFLTYRRNLAVMFSYYFKLTVTIRRLIQYLSFLDLRGWSSMRKVFHIDGSYYNIQNKIIFPNKRQSNLKSFEQNVSMS
jgi:hypothetical protein